MNKLTTILRKVDGGNKTTFSGTYGHAMGFGLDDQVLLRKYFGTVPDVLSGVTPIKIPFVLTQSNNQVTKSAQGLFEATGCENAGCMGDIMFTVKGIISPDTIQFTKEYDPQSLVGDTPPIEYSGKSMDRGLTYVGEWYKDGSDGDVNNNGQFILRKNVSR